MGARFGVCYTLNKLLGTNLYLSDPDSPVLETIKVTAQTTGDAIEFARKPSLSNFAALTKDYLYGVNVMVPSKPVLRLPKTIQDSTGLTKVPVSGYPLMEVQKLLEQFARTAEGDD
jgi:hypothetical protein